VFCTKPPFTITNIQLSAMDVLVLTTMKNAAKCDTKSELQNPVNLYVFERMLRFRVLLEACLFECLFSPLASPPRQTEGALADFGLSDRNSLWSVDPSGETTGNSFQCRVCLRNQRGALAIVQNCLGPEATLDQSDPGSSVPPFGFENFVFAPKGTLNFRTSNQARGPAEFKHITKRRKRN
jgi:hypothetical protein